MSAYLDDVLFLGLNEGLEGLDAGGGGGVGVHQQQVLIQVEYSTKLLKYLERKSDLCTPRKETARLSPNFHMHASVADLYIPTIGPHIFLPQNRQTDRRNI
jgi:hypothetical protein